MRIKELRQQKNLTQDEIVEITGIKKRSYCDYEAEKADIPLSKLRIIATVLGVTVSELIDEQVIPKNYTLPMIENRLEEPSAVYAKRTDVISETQNIPLYNIHAQAGMIPIFDNIGINKTDEYIVIPRAPKCDGAIFITGDSMYPLLKSGDIVAYKMITNIKEGIFWGEMYIVSVRNDDEDYISVKYIHKGKNEDYIKLVSQNSHHESKEVLLENVKSLAIVKASIRINSMS